LLSQFFTFRGRRAFYADKLPIALVLPSPLSIKV